MAQTCHDIYKTHLDMRRNVPLREGGYKAAESIRNLQGMLDTLDVIERRVRGKQPFWPSEHLGSCNSEGKGNWLKSVPARICKEIGYNLIPALRLIVADTSKLDRAAFAVVDRCEEVRLKLAAGGVGREYVAMKQRGSQLRPLLEAAMALGQR